MAEYGFPVRAGNRFRLLVDGPVFFPQMLQAIRGARSYVLMEMYLVKSDAIASSFCNAFIAAAQRGVTVQLLLDAFGSRTFSRQDRERLSAGGVQLAFYNPLRLRQLKRNLQRTHRKYLVVDGDVAYVGGSGITADFTGSAGWRETMLEVQGPVVADWQALFARTWPDWSSRPVPTAGVPRGLPDGQGGRVAWTARGSTQLEIKRVLLNRTRNARARIWLATAYFVPSRKLRRALRRAALRGVDARLLVPGPVTDHPAVRFASRRFYTRLLRDGVRIFEYRDRFMHSKVALADQWSSIGSSNMDRWNLRWNLEANQEVDDAGFAAEVAQMLRTDFAHSEELDYREWQRRSGLHRLREWLWGKVDNLLGRWMPHGPPVTRNRSLQDRAGRQPQRGHADKGKDRLDG